MNYQEVYQRSIDDPSGFWADQAEHMHWYRYWDHVLDDSQCPFYRWFVGGQTNLCYNAVDRHVFDGGRNRAALIWESAETGQSRTLTYQELYRDVNRLAGVLKNLGVRQGDRVLIYMPMVPEAVIAMLACVRLGAIHVVVFAGFSVTALAQLIDACEPTIILTADAGMRKGTIVRLKDTMDKALQVSTTDSVRDVLVLNRGLAPYTLHRWRDLDWHTQLEQRGEHFVEPAQLESTHPSYILYTSGTTGQPKGVVRDTGGHMVALATSMRQIYNMNPLHGDVYWATSDIGWVVGHSYIVYGPLLHGLPTVVYEGTPDYPDPGVWWRVIEKYGVTCLFSAPTALRVVRKFPEHWITDHDISSLRYVFAAGEPLDETTCRWVSKTLGVPMIDHYWQTESGWPMITNSPGIEMLPIKPGSPTRPAMGYRLKVVDSNGEPVPTGTKGLLVQEGPLVPGMLMTLWNDNERYVRNYWRYFPNKDLYLTGDYASEDEDGYFWMLGRADEVLNVAGHRIGTREIEEVLAAHPALAEVSVIGVRDELKGEAVLVIAVLKTDVFIESEDDVAREMRQMVRDEIGAIATPSSIHFVAALPKTRSGKIMRRVMRAIYEGEHVGDVSTIEDLATVDMLREALQDTAHMPG
jgi:propionate--CoA ligase